MQARRPIGGSVGERVLTNKGYLQCKNTGSGALTAQDAVTLDVAQYNTDGDSSHVAVQKATSGDKVLGIAHSLAAVGGKLLVQINGPATANVAGDTDVIVGDLLKAHTSTDGAFEKDGTATANLTNGALALIGRTAAGVADVNVLLMNPYGFVASQ